jgi:hypothetical protein
VGLHLATQSDDSYGNQDATDTKHDNSRQNEVISQKVGSAQADEKTHHD